MKKQRLLVFLTLICIVALMLPLAVSAAGVPDNGWYQNADKSWSYRRDGQWVMDEVIKVGAKYYGFDYEGYMITGEEFWWDGNYYSAKTDGTLRVNEWYQADGEWYYYAAEGKSAYDFLQIGKTWYFFTGDGRMATDEVVWSNDYNGYYVINKAGTDSKKLSYGWTSAFGSDYYGYQDEDGDLRIAASEMIEYAGKLYYFHYDGKMATNEMVYEYDTGREVLATADGSILKSGWAQVNGNWYYAEEYNLYTYGVYSIGSKNYYFRDGKMYNIPGEYEDYYVTADGSLMKNQWRNDTIGSPDEIGWAYYGENSRRIYYGETTIGGTKYYFSNGIMQTKVVRTCDDGVYVFDKDGKGAKVNGWFQHPDSKKWMFAVDGDLAEGILTLSDGTYAFNEGYMQTNTYVSAGRWDRYNWVYDYYLVDEDGKVITSPGWHSVGGQWYYVKDTTGALKEGWLQSGSKWYYLTPAAYHNTVFRNPTGDDYYAADNTGACTQLTGNGWRLLSWGRVYLVNGKPIVYGWKQIGKDWYYFDGFGKAAVDDYWWIEGKLYVFDADGKMCKNGWFKVWGEDCYVDANGVVATGLKTIGGKQYLFSQDGWLYKNGVYEHNNTSYWLNGDGTVRAKLKDGWNQVGSKWYYLDGRFLLRNCLLRLGDTCYGFGSDYAMCTNGIQYVWGDYYMFDANGKALSGWQKFDGKWYYADPESDNPYIYSNGVYWINGKDYLFKDGCLFIGSTMMWGSYYTTDSNGVVISVTDMKEGWNYTGTGYVYIKNGERPTGWVGDYYVEDGEMLVNTTVEYGGKYYYLGADGRYIRNGWYEMPYGDYIYANSNGTLRCSEWLKLGKNYYYFFGTRMVCGTIEYIDGQYHEFDENGVWLGQFDVEETTYPAKADGWQKIGGKWYYYHANTRQFGSRYIGGSWYYFNRAEDGAMVTNELINGYYYGSNGVRAAYTGWKKIDGYWIFFDADHSVHAGWIKSGSGWYYTDYIYDFDREKEYTAMVTNEAIVSDGQLYCFNGSGYCAGAVTGSGWKSFAGDWYYLENGKVIQDDFYQIGKDLYYFDYDGKMMVNNIAYGETVAGWGEMYFGADGKAVKTAGWKQTEFGWVYIGANGFLYTDGIYRIGGADYSFYNGIWVQK